MFFKNYMCSTLKLTINYIFFLNNDHVGSPFIDRTRAGTNTGRGTIDLRGWSEAIVFASAIAPGLLDTTRRGGKLTIKL